MSWAEDVAHSHRRQQQKIHFAETIKCIFTLKVDRAMTQQKKGYLKVSAGNTEED